jgi:hypothetical protein
MIVVAPRSGVAQELSDREYAERFLRRKRIRGVHVPPCTPDALKNAQRLLRNEFELIGETYLLPAGFSWRENPSRDKEWQIAHHKHYWAVDLLHAFRASGSRSYLDKWIELTASWLEEMGTGFIAQSDAQVEAKRVEHWVYAYVLLREGVTPSLPPSFLRRFLDRLATETRYIAGHLKPTRNHRTFQLFAICLSSITFPEFDRDGDLARLGVGELTHNLLTDILPDGVQVELSTHYHQLVLETAVSFLELARANGIEVVRELEDRVARALAFAMHVQWPDGHLPLVNDSDDGSQLELLRRGAALFEDEELLWGATLGRQGRPPARSSRFFDESGYFVLSDGWGRNAATQAGRQHVLYDCGPLGEGSHSHYDVFNFCFYAGGAPAIVDPGRYTYSSEIRDGIDWRHYFKSTAAHNTVAIDGLDQTRYLSRTKHGPDARVRGREFLLGNSSDWVRASVASAEYAPVHERFFLYVRREYLWIVDRIDPVDGREHEAVVRYHLSDHLADSLALCEYPRGAEASCAGLLLNVQTRARARAAVEAGWMSTSYGTKRPAPVLAVGQRGDEPMFFCSVVAPHGGTPPRVISTHRDGHVVTEIHGTSREGPHRDSIVTAFAEKLPDCELPGLRCRARDLALRRDGAGCATYLVASGAEYVEVDGVRLDVGPSGAVEWKREVSS